MGVSDLTSVNLVPWHPWRGGPSGLKMVLPDFCQFSGFSVGASARPGLLLVGGSEFGH
jgi:hypothetical protein